MLFRNQNQTSVFGVNSLWFISVARTRVDLFLFRILNLTSHPVRWSTHTWVSYQAPHIRRPTTSFGNSIKRRTFSGFIECHTFESESSLGKWGKIKEVELVNPHLPFRSFSGSSFSDDFLLSSCGLSLCILSFVFHPNSCKIRPGPKTSKVLKANPPLVDVPRSPSLFRASALYGRQSGVVRPFLLDSFVAFWGRGVMYYGEPFLWRGWWIALKQNNICLINPRVVLEFLTLG